MDNVSFEKLNFWFEQTISFFYQITIPFLWLTNDFVQNLGDDSKFLLTKWKFFKKRLNSIIYEAIFFSRIKFN